MSDAPSGEGIGGGPARPEPRGGGWAKWLTLIALVFVAEVALIFVLGEKQFPPPRTTAYLDVPHLALVNGSDELMALTDPTLFVLPHANDFASAAISRAPAPAFRYTEPWQPLLLSTNSLGAVFNQFMRTNAFAMVQLDFKPGAQLSKPAVSLASEFPQSSTLEVVGNLSRRPLLNESEIHWPLLAIDDVLPPSTVWALVDAGGGVVSAVVLPPENPADLLGRVNIGDTNALAIVRGLRFAPTARPTVGVVIFHWLTVPRAAANPPVTAP